MKNQRKFQISFCSSCNNIFYLGEKEKDSIYCLRCTKYLGRKRPLLYERKTNQEFTSRQQAAEWLWGIPEHYVKLMLETGVEAEIYDEDSGKTLGFYTLEYWLPKKRNHGIIPKILVTESKINSMINSGAITR